MRLVDEMEKCDVGRKRAIKRDRDELVVIK